MYISTRSNSEQVHILGHQSRYYSSLQKYLQIMPLPNSYAGYIEIAAAQQIFNISIAVVIAGTASFPPVPNPPLNNSLYVVYHPHAMHYSALAPLK